MLKYIFDFEHFHKLAFKHVENLTKLLIFNYLRMLKFFMFINIKKIMLSLYLSALPQIKSGDLLRIHKLLIINHLIHLLDKTKVILS